MLKECSVHSLLFLDWVSFVGLVLGQLKSLKM